jgi:hypothetical protein
MRLQTIQIGWQVGQIASVQRESTVPVPMPKTAHSSLLLLIYVGNFGNISMTWYSEAWHLIIHASSPRARSQLDSAGAASPKNDVRLSVFWCNTLWSSVTHKTHVTILAYVIRAH